MMNHMSDAEFWRFFRCDRREVELLADKLRDDIETPCSNSAETKLLALIAYLRSNAHQLVVGRVLRLFQSSISRYVSEVSSVLERRSSEFIKFPVTPANIRAKEMRFGEAGMEAVGIIDCTHVQIQIPNRAAERIYLNRRLYHSVNVQIVVDAFGAISNVLARYPGSCHDAYILNQSLLPCAFTQAPVLIGHHLLGDSGYPEWAWLKTPIFRAEIDAELRYNRRLMKVRSYVERVIGWWKHRYSAIHGEVRLDIENVPAFIVASACLWNWTKDRQPLPAPNDDEGWVDADEWGEVRVIDPEA